MARFERAVPAPKAPAIPDDFAKGVELESSLVEYLKSPAAKETVALVAPAIADKAINAAIAYVTNRSEVATWRALVDCTPKSVVESVKKLASVGLCVSQLTGEAFLTPRFSKADKAQVATAIPGVRGMEKIIFESGMVDVLDPADLLVLEPARLPNPLAVGPNRLLERKLLGQRQRVRDLSPLRPAIHRRSQQSIQMEGAIRYDQRRDWVECDP